MTIREPLPSEFDALGMTIIPAVLTSSECADICLKIKRDSLGRAGTRRLLAHAWCRELATSLQRHSVIRRFVPESHHAVQCTYFEKSADQNWLVSIHQDRSIPVASRVKHPSLQGWSEKEGVTFVQGPLAVLEQMIAVRIHLDPCQAEDGPLKVVPGSHIRGYIGAEAAVQLKQEQGEVPCPLDLGGALLLRPLLLHSSSKSTGTGLRRVLHFVFGPAELPLGLQWNEVC